MFVDDELNDIYLLCHIFHVFQMTYINHSTQRNETKQKTKQKTKANVNKTAQNRTDTNECPVFFCRKDTTTLNWLH